MRKHYLFTFLPLLLFCFFTLSPLQVLADDYVDDINTSATKNEAGHQVIYEMNVGSFTQAGTFDAARQQLGELKRLGVDVVWLMPVYPRGGGINSPYAATNFQQTNPAYGTIADLKAFVTAAHALNMEVWLDWVPNHTATNADWVTTHPEYYKKNGNSFVHPNNYSDVYQLNYGSADLQRAMNDCLKFWIDQADIDGYRCDYISSPEIPASYWQTAIPEIKNYKSGKHIAFLGEADIAQDVTRLKNVGFDYDYAWGYQSSLVNYGSTGVYAAPLKTNADKLLNASASVSFSRMLYLTNHDQNWNESKKTLTEKYGLNRYPLTVLAYTLYGMPLIYNGQEVGGNQALNYFEDTKINWSTTDNKMFHILRTLTALKHAVPALNDRTAVSWVTTNPVNNNVLAFTRKSGNSEILVVLNMAASASSATLTGLTAGPWSLWLNSETIAQGVSRKQQYLSATQNVSLEAKGYRVYVKGTYSEETLPEPEVYIPTLENANEVCIFFETTSESDYAVWAWGSLGGGDAYCTNTSWPGDAMELKGLSATGSYIYKWTQNKTNVAPEYLIISKSGGNAKIFDGVEFVNHGYYVEGQTTPAQVITTDISPRTTLNVSPSALTIYDLQGRIVKRQWTEDGDQWTMDNNLPKGIYIVNGVKVVVK